MMKELTPKQQRFCEEYIVDLNATQAAIRAGYSEKTANEQGCQNLAKLNIQEKIGELQKNISKKTELNAEYVINGLIDVHKKSVEPKLDKNGNKYIDASGANRSLELLGKHLKLFTDKVEYDGEIKIILENYGNKNPDNSQ